MPATQSPKADPNQQPAIGATALVGQPIDRADGRVKVTGTAKYSVEWPVTKVAHAVAFISTIASARIKSIDTTAAEKVPGVLGILTHENAPKLKPVGMERKEGRPGQTWLPMQDDQVRYAGQFLGVVIAETLTAAMEAAGRVMVFYTDEQPPKLSMLDNEAEAFKPKKIGRGDPPDSSRGDAENALAAAPVKLDEHYVTPCETHNPMEMHGTLAAWDGDKLTLHDSTQWIDGVRGVVSDWFDLPKENVRVICKYLGGGFGCKGSIWPHVAIAAMAARHVGRPVKFSLTRQQMFSQVGYRPKTLQRVALGATADGKLTAIIHDVTSQTSPWKDEWAEQASKQTRMLYKCENVKTSQRLIPLTANTPTQMRAPGHASGTFALECAMDELAYALKIDPIELRLRNYSDFDEDEKKPYSSKALKECYKQGAERFGWTRRKPEPRSMRDGRFLIGLGMATATYPTNWSPSKAKLRLMPDGRAIASAASHDLGTGTYTIMAQIAAETLGLPLEKVTFDLGDSLFVEAPVAGGSQTAVSVGAAVKQAAENTRAKLIEMAFKDEKSPLHGKDPADLATGDGRVFVKGSPSTGETYVELLRRNGNRPLEVLASTEPDPEAMKHSRHAFGAQFAEVRIDPDLGEIRLAKLTGAFAAGRILNAKTGRSQVLGGIVWSASMALFEETVFDPNRAKVVNDNLADYLVPVNADVPPIDAFFVEEHDEQNPLGAKGIGELGNTGMAAAIANAVYHATGKRVRELPIRLEKIL